MDADNLARLIAVALEGAARNIRQEFLTPSRPSLAEEPPLIRASASEPAVEAVEIAPRYTKKRTLVRIKNADRRKVACSDGVSRRWYSGHANRTAMRSMLAKGQVESVYWTDSVHGLGEEVAHHYYGEKVIEGVLMSEREFLLYAKHYRPKGGKKKKGAAS